MEKYILLFLVFFPIIGGISNYFIGKKFNKVREINAILIGTIELALAILVAFIYPLNNEFIGMEFKADGFRSIYGIIASFMWFATIIFSKEYMFHHENKDRYYFFYLLTFGATLGVFYSNTLWTTFLFFEMMSLTSFALVMQEETKEAINAAYTYLAIAIISGMILLMGLFLIQSEVGSLDFETIYNYCKNGISKKIYTGGVLLLLGFGAKAGMFPLHIWLPKAHPVAPAPASALLSGILTKTGIYGIIIISCYIFNGSKSFAILLLILAVITMLLGAILAVFSINFKRTLACSSMSQIGFILVGLAMVIFLGEENILAFEGSFLHMVNHSLIKLSLFMIAGVIFMNLHELDLNKIRGFGRNKILLMICFTLAMLGIMGIPLFNGYISKTLIHEAIVELANELSGTNKVLIKIVEYSFLFAGGLTIAYMSKIFSCVFIEKNNDKELQAKYDNIKHNGMNISSTIVIVLASFILPFLGFIPKFTSNKLLPLASSFFKISEELHYVNYFSFENLKGALISLGVGALVYFIFIRKVLMKKDNNGNIIYLNIWPAKLDLENFYKLLIAGFTNFFSFLFTNAKKLFSIILKGLIFITILFTRAFADGFDGLLYLIRKYLLRSYKYAFNYTPLSYRLSKAVAHVRHEDDEANAADRYFLLLNAHKEVLDAVNATFSFDFLAACLGVVGILLIALLF